MLDPTWTRAVTRRLRPPKYERIKAIITAKEEVVDDKAEDVEPGKDVLLAVVSNDEGGKEAGA